MKVLIFKTGLWILWGSVVAFGPLLAVSVFGLRSVLAGVIQLITVVYSCFVYRKIATGGPEHLRLAVALSAAGFVAISLYLTRRVTGI